MTVDIAMLDELLKDIKTPEDIASLHSQMLQRMINRSLEAEMEAHIGYVKHDKIASGETRGNSRNGKMSKVIQSHYGDLAIETPRDRDGSFTAVGCEASGSVAGNVR